MKRVWKGNKLYFGNSRQFSTYEMLRNVALSRFSSTEFGNGEITDDMVGKLMEIAIAAPSSFNMQPYKIVIVRSPEKRKFIADHAMLGRNGRLIEGCSMVAIFASFRGKVNIHIFMSIIDVVNNVVDPTELTEQLVALETKNGANPEYLRSLPATLSFLFSQRGEVSKKFRKVVTHLLSPLQPTPTVSVDGKAWSEKNTAFAAQNYMLAATSMGLATAPLEGLDERRLSFLVDIPIDRFSIPFIVATGFPVSVSENGERSETKENNSARRQARDANEVDRKKSIAFPKKIRYEMNQICCDESFDKPFFY